MTLLEDTIVQLMQGTCRGSNELWCWNDKYSLNSCCIGKCANEDTPKEPYTQIDGLLEQRNYKSEKGNDV